MTAKEIIERMYAISEETGIDLNDLYLTADIPTEEPWNEWKNEKHWNDKFIVNAEPFVCVDTNLVYHPDIPFILRLRPNLDIDWTMKGEDINEFEVNRLEQVKNKYYKCLGLEECIMTEEKKKKWEMIHGVISRGCK